MLKKILLSVCVLSLIGLSAAAETRINFDENSRTLNIHGSVEAESVKGFVGIVISLSDTALSSIEENVETAENVIFKTVLADNSGVFSEQIILPGSFKSGQYTVTSACGNAKFENLFAFIGTDFSDETLAAINSAENGSGVLSAVKNVPDFRLNQDRLESFGASAANYVFSQKPSGGYTRQSFARNWSIGEASARLSAGDISLGDMLSVYSAYYSSSYGDTYNALSAAAKAEAENLIRNSQQFEQKSFDKAFEDIIRTAKMKTAVDSKALQTEYISYARANGINLSQYNSLSEYGRESVFLRVLSKISAALCADDVTKVFNAEVSAEAGNNSGGGTGGGGAGGGSGGGGSVSGGGGVAMPSVIGGNTGADSAFSDTKGHWAEKYIQDMKKKGVINGYQDGTFKPSEGVTRAEITKMLCKMLGAAAVYDDIFKDVGKSEWFFGFVGAAYKKGWISGTGENMFLPGSKISREDAAVIIYRAYAVSGDKTVTFSDEKEISAYALEAIKALSQAGILTGDETGRVNPKKSVSRGEIAAILSRAAAFNAR